MPDKLKTPKPFEVVQPKIPGVSQSYASKPEPKPASKQPVANEMPPDETAPPKPKFVYLWAIGSGTVVLLLVVMIWWARATTPAAQALVPVAAAVSPTSVVHVSAPDLPVAPGRVATTDELSHAWMSKEFSYRNAPGDSFRALLVRIPGNKYWAFSLHVPYSTCELEYITDLEKLHTVYKFAAVHPMVGDPCTHTLYDLTQYATGPNGLVRGAVIAGPGVRPPLAIEVDVNGDQILATRSEKQ